tara:strand:+ start:27957 stop:30251 length:2295 start_codon:yes stop_codon:yes gene_type:complete
MSSQDINTLLRDFITDGVPSSGAHQPVKADMRDTFNALLLRLTGANAGAIIKTAKATLDADLVPAADVMAWVIGDATAANDGVYQKQGATTTGSWTKVGPLPYSVIQLNNADAGTANAIVVTTSVGIPSAAYSALYVLNITAANTGAVTVAINGATAVPLVTNTNAAIPSGYLAAGMAVMCVDDGTSLRMLSYGDVESAVEVIQLACEAAAAEAALYDGPWLDNVTALLADTSLTYTASQPGTVAEGDYVRTRKEGYSYEVAASDASDNDTVTTGGVKLYRLYWSSVEFGSVTRPDAPTGAAGSAGNLDGTYYYRVTFTTAEGETSPGSGSAAIVVSNQRIDLTIPTSTSRLVTGRKIYRTVGTGGDAVLVKLVATISDNTTTSYEDNTADGSLGDDAYYVDTTGNLFKNNGNVFAGTSDLATVFGRAALPAGGYASTAIGSNALQENISGIRNTAIGHDALKMNTTGANNVAVGVHASNDTTTGGSNIAIGYSALFANTTGSENIAIGPNANADAETASQNVAIGPQAMQLRTSGDDNVAIGYQAVRRGSGTGNIGVGRTTGAGLSTGNFNTILGYLSGSAVAGGSFNAIIGASAGTRLTSGGSNVLIGPSAGQWLTTESNRLFIDNAARTDAADAIVKALVFGVFAASTALQQLHVNGLLYANVGVALPSRAVTTSDTVTIADHTIKVTGTASVTLTLPAAQNYPGKILHIRNLAAYTVVSNTTNVIPVDGSSPAAAILPATAGAWATLQAVGYNWDTIAYG